MTVIDAARQVRHARDHRRPLAPRRLCRAGRAGQRATATRRRSRTPPRCGPSTRCGRRIRSSRADLAGGVTTLQVLPGSANLFGGRSAVLKVVPGAHGAGDEVPRRAVRPEDGVRREPEARLRSRAARRRAWATSPAIAPRGFRPSATAASGTSGTPTRRARRRSAISRMETLAEVLRGNILVHNHCYRADEMAQMIDIAKEFGYQIRSFHHVRRGLQDRRPARAAATSRASVWADWGGFKMEALDGVKANAAIVHARRRPRHHPLRRSVGLAAPEPGSGQGDGGRQRRSASPIADGRRHQVDHAQPGVGARARRSRSARSSRARTPTSCCGRAIRSASTRAPRRSGSTARCASIAARPTPGGAPISSWASCRAEGR